MGTTKRTLDAKPRLLSAEAAARLDALSNAEIEANAHDDPDSPPMTEGELSRGVAGRRVRRVREGLGLSQRDFATEFRINLRRLQDWEQGRFEPDSAVLAYIRVIELEPEVVRRVMCAV